MQRIEVEITGIRKVATVDKLRELARMKFINDDTLLFVDGVQCRFGDVANQVEVGLSELDPPRRYLPSRPASSPSAPAPTPTPSPSRPAPVPRVAPPVPPKGAISPKGAAPVPPADFDPFAENPESAVSPVPQDPFAENPDAPSRPSAESDPNAAKSKKRLTSREKKARWERKRRTIALPLALFGLGALAIAGVALAILAGGAGEDPESESAKKNEEARRAVLEKYERQREGDERLMTSLEALAKKETLTDEEFARAKSMVAELVKRNGSIAISCDEETKRVVGFEEEKKKPRWRSAFEGSNSAGGFGKSSETPGAKPPASEDSAEEELERPISFVEDEPDETPEFRQFEDSGNEESPFSKPKVEPTPFEPEPTPFEPEPTPFEPEPTPVEPEPTPVEPEPTSVKTTSSASAPVKSGKKGGRKLERVTFDDYFGEAEREQELADVVSTSEELEERLARALDRDEEITLRASSEPYALSGVFRIKGSVAIKSESENPGDVAISFGPKGGLLVSSGAARLEGITLRASGAREAEPGLIAVETRGSLTMTNCALVGSGKSGTGIIARNGSTKVSLTDVEISGFATGVEALNNADLTVGGACVFGGCGRGISLSDGAGATLDGARFENDEVGCAVDRDGKGSMNKCSFEGVDTPLDLHQEAVPRFNVKRTNKGLD